MIGERVRFISSLNSIGLHLVKAIVPTKTKIIKMCWRTEKSPSSRGYQISQDIDLNQRHQHLGIKWQMAASISYPR
jgi:hypothetical protein